MTHTYLNREIQYTVIYKKRKSLGIYIDFYGNIELRVPKETTQEAIVKLLETKWGWIVEKQHEMKTRTAGHVPKTYEEGEQFLYLGKKYPMTILPVESTADNNLRFESSQFLCSIQESVLNEDEQKKEVIQQLFKRFYYKECKRLVEKKIKEIQPMISVKPSKISISDDKSKWGSCDSKRQLTFNWKLAMAPDKVILYVVIHEMCHLEHLNHDRSFWRLVGKFMGDYEEQQLWLQNSSWKMTI